MKKLIRITTVPVALKTLLKGQLKFMSQHFEVIGVSSNGEEMIDIIRNEGIKTHVIEMTRSITPLKDLKSTYQLYRYFRKERPLIVHTHTPKAGTVGMFAAWLARVPHRLHTVAGLPLLEAKGLKRALLNSVEKWTYKCATLVLPNSFGLKDIILQEGFIKASKLKVIGSGSSNGIDTAHFDPRLISEEKKQELKHAIGISSDDFVFVFIGRIVSDKGINELLEAFDELSGTFGNCKLILVGARESHLDPILSTSESIIKTNQNIKEVGLQRDVRPFLAISNVLAFPSYREGFPNVVLQASAMELPCIVTDINGCNEIITNHKNGIIIPAKSKSALKDAMTYCLKNPAHVKTMAEQSRSNIINLYEQDYIWKELLKLYNTLEE